jgi:hypothetical protein
MGVVSVIYYTGIRYTPNIVDKPARPAIDGKPAQPAKMKPLHMQGAHGSYIDAGQLLQLLRLEEIPARWPATTAPATPPDPDPVDVTEAFAIAAASNATEFVMADKSKLEKYQSALGGTQGATVVDGLRGIFQTIAGQARTLVGRRLSDRGTVNGELHALGYLRARALRNRFSASELKSSKMDGKPLAAVSQRCPLTIANRELRCVGRLYDEDEPEGSPSPGECDPEQSGAAGLVTCWLEPVVAKRTPNIRLEVRKIRDELQACFSRFETKGLPSDADWPTVEDDKLAPAPILLSEPGAGSWDGALTKRAQVGMCPGRLADAGAMQLIDEWALPLRFTWLTR